MLFSRDPSHCNTDASQMQQITVLVLYRGPNVIASSLLSLFSRLEAEKILNSKAVDVSLLFKIFHIPTQGTILNLPFHDAFLRKLPCRHRQ